MPHELVSVKKSQLAAVVAKYTVAGCADMAV